MSTNNKQPNILIVMTDHQRGDTVLPEHPAITPHLDELCAEGVCFTNVFTPMAHCCPARASFMSGLMPSRHGVWNNICNEQALSRGPKPGVKLWSEFLADSGYDLRYTGKWHVSVDSSPVDHGWREYYVSGKTVNEHGSSWDDINKAAADWNRSSVSRRQGEILRDGYPPYFLYGEVPEMAKHDKFVCNEALDILGDLRNSQQPWCLFCGFTGPHDPYMIEQKYLDMYDVNDIKLPENYDDEMSDKPGLYRRMRQLFGQLSVVEYRDAIRHFYAYCSFLDEQFGRILKQLDEIGQRDNTVVVYCSDHGDYCGEHGLFAKGIPAFRGAYNVPAVIRWPQGISTPGRRVDKLVSLTDFAPTFLELAGLYPAEGNFSGRSIMGFLRNSQPSTAWRDALLTQCNGVELYASQRSIITERYRYTFNGFDFDELYDLANDPGEMVNLAEMPEYQNLAKELCGQLWSLAAREGDGLKNSYITVGLAPAGPAAAFK